MTLGMNPDTPQTHRLAALALLTGDFHLTRRAGSFLGQCCVDPTPLTAAQTGWLNALLERSGLPPFDAGEAA